MRSPRAEADPAARPPRGRRLRDRPWARRLRHPPAARARAESVDARFSVRGTQARPDDIVVVEIDDQTFNDLERAVAVPALPARASDRPAARRPGAKVIAFDVQFTEPTAPKRGQRADRSGRRAPAASSSRPPRSTSTATADVFGGEAVLREIGARAGNTVSSPTRAGCSAACPYQVDGPDQLRRRRGRSGDRTRSTEGRRRRRRAWIDFRGPPGTFRPVSYSDGPARARSRPPPSAARPWSSAPRRRRCRTSTRPRPAATS